MSGLLHFLVTAGPTREAIDPVRFLSNRSSGRMGFALAQAAVEAGHRVTLVTGPVALVSPPGVTRIDVETADDMFRAVEQVVADAPPLDVAVLAAAVADYRPVKLASQKIKKQDARLVLEFERTRDILGSMRSPIGFRGLLVGFAAETENVVANAREKLRRKGCDLMVANDVSRPDVGFDAADNEVVLIFPSGESRRVPRAPKLEIARQIVRLLIGMSSD